MGIVGNSRLTNVNLAALVLMGLVLGLPNRALAQDGNKGLNTVWQKTNNTLSQIASPAFVDASAYTAQPDICAKLNHILSTAPAGVVIDARGVTPAVGTAQRCSMNPWGTAQNPITSPSTMLLPAGTITICLTWGPPKYTRIVGEGPGQLGTLGTTLKVGSMSDCNGQAFNGTSMITMAPGCASSVCFSVSIEDLALDGQDGQGNANVDGIDNPDSQELSYVKHVAMVNIGKVGLLIGSQAAHSGPYSDISIAVTSSAQACVEVNEQPRGIHGLSCTCMQNGSACSNTNAGIYLGSTPTSSPVFTSIEDVYVDGFMDGIYVGRSGPSTDAPAPGSLLFNITGGSNVTNLIHISSAQSFSSPCPPQQATAISVNNVCDITIMGATSAANNTIVDDLDASTNLSNSTDPTVGMYIVGEQVTGGGNSIGNSRFTTSPSVPSWAVGTTTPTTPCAIGDLYSITAGTSGTTLWGCTGGGLGGPQWSPIL